MLFNTHSLNLTDDKSSFVKIQDKKKRSTAVAQISIFFIEASSS